MNSINDFIHKRYPPTSRCSSMYWGTTRAEDRTNYALLARVKADREINGMVSPEKIEEQKRRVKIKR